VRAVDLDGAIARVIARRPHDDGSRKASSPRPILDGDVEERE
jgi:hypothetical protein